MEDNILVDTAKGPYREFFSAKNDKGTTFSDFFTIEKNSKFLSEYRENLVNSTQR